jgi:hypothetical protein
MDIELVERLLDELFPTLQALEKQSAAILRFLKDKGIASDEQLAPYMEEAGDASSVRWRATRLRIHGMLDSAQRSAQPEAKDVEQTPEKEKNAQRPEGQLQVEHGDRKGMKVDAQKEREASRATEGEGGERKERPEDKPNKEEAA